VNPHSGNSLDFSVLVGPLPVGVGWGEVYYVGGTQGFEAIDLPSKQGLVTISGGFEPVIEPFIEARARLRLADNIHSFDGILLTTRQKEYIDADNAGFSTMPREERKSESKTYISDVFDVRVD
jgi:hypothetical protein